MKLLLEELENLWIVQGFSGFKKMVGREDFIGTWCREETY